jgi:hypothetical protein
MSKTLPMLAVVVAGALACGVALAVPVRVAGTVTRVDGDLVVVTTADARADNLRVDGATRITIRTPADHSILAQGRYVGVTATPQADGTLIASIVNVFPESRRGAGEGHYPMKDRPAGTTMTNATVKAATKLAPRPAGNATIAAATSGAGGMRITLEYVGGSQTVVVPDGAAVVTSSDGDRSALVVGAHVIASGERGDDGTIAAARISVGARGSVPPQ